MPQEGLPVKHLDPAAMARLQRYAWPGNVRELENLCRRLAALYSEETIGLDVIEVELAEKAEPGALEGAAGTYSQSSAVERHRAASFGTHRDRLPEPRRTTPRAR